jgi:hypothetical protein
MTVAGGDFGNERRGGLRTAMAEVECVADSSPRLGRNRRKKPAGAIGGSAVGNAFEGVDPAGGDTANFA